MNRVWYRLTGKSEQAIRRSIEISESGIKAPMEEIHKLAEILGQKSPVLEYGGDESGQVRAYATYPEIFAHPSSGRDEFYMYCPVGYKKGENLQLVAGHFIPEDGIEMSEEEAIGLERILFIPHGGSVPIVSKDPILLRTEQPRPSGSSGP